MQTLAFTVPRYLPSYANWNFTIYPGVFTFLVEPLIDVLEKELHQRTSIKKVSKGQQQEILTLEDVLQWINLEKQGNDSIVWHGSLADHLPEGIQSEFKRYVDSLLVVDSEALNTPFQPLSYLPDLLLLSCGSRLMYTRQFKAVFCPECQCSYSACDCIEHKEGSDGYQYKRFCCPKEHNFHATETMHFLMQ